MIIKGIEFYVSNYNNQDLEGYVKELILEALLKMIEYSGKSLKRLKRKKRKKKIEFKIEAALATSAIDHIKLFQRE